MIQGWSSSTSDMFHLVTRRILACHMARDHTPQCSVKLVVDVVRVELQYVATSLQGCT